MSHWADNPEYFDQRFREMALRGDFGPDLQARVETGDLCDWEIYYQIPPDMQQKAATDADRSYWEDKAASADARRKAEREL